MFLSAVILLFSFVPQTDFLSMQHPQIHVYCHRHEPSSIPQDEEGRRKWVYDCFAEKDRYVQ